LENLFVDGRIILKIILEEQSGRPWAVFISLWIGTSGRLL
jgi:hypothetical protein